MGQRVKSSDSEISPHLSGRARRPLNILTVDDHIDTLEILRMLLESEGFAVRTAEGVDEAALQLRQQLPDLIITDHLMPGTTGLAF